MYFKTTSSNRKPAVQYSDLKILQKLFDHFRRNGKTYIEEITPLDVQLLFNLLDKEGKAEATLKSYSRILSKIFKWLIDMEIIEMKNPVKKLIIPKKKGVVRDYLLDKTEIQALLTITYRERSRSHTPIQAIVKFLIYTGAHLGEVLHAEWEDFDLDRRIWHIRHKLNCPTFYGIGWSPKWHKERMVQLFPEAIEVLQTQPKYKEVFGTVPIRDDSGNIKRHEMIPANFIFPKCEIRFENGIRRKRYTRVDNVSRAWITLK